MGDAFIPWGLLPVIPCHMVELAASRYTCKFSCDPVAFLNREEPSWGNPLVWQSFCCNGGHG